VGLAGLAATYSPARRPAGIVPGSCRTIPTRAWSGVSREVAVPLHGPSRFGSFFPLRPRAPCGAQSRPSIRPCGFLSATFRAALRLSFRLPSLPPCGGRLGFGGLKKSDGLSVNVYSRARSHYCSTRELLPAVSPPWADTLLIIQPGNAELPPHSHIDAELSADTRSA